MSPEKDTKKSKEEYNEIVEDYEEASKRPLRAFSYEPTLEHYLGDLSGDRVLDLACGEGVSSRMAYEMGAEEVVGIDISDGLIEKAREKTDKEEISYAVGDAANTDLTRHGEFDTVTAVMFFNYLPDEETLRSAFENVREVLADDGELYALIPTPENQTGYNNYGVTMEPQGEPEAGVEVEVTLGNFQGEEFCSFTNHYWPREKYEEVIEDAGFELEWLPGIVSDEGKEAYPEGFWDEYEERPLYQMFRAEVSEGE